MSNGQKEKLIENMALNAEAFMYLFRSALQLALPGECEKLWKRCNDYGEILRNAIDEVESTYGETEE